MVLFLSFSISLIGGWGLCCFPNGTMTGKGIVFGIGSLTAEREGDSTAAVSVFTCCVTLRNIGRILGPIVITGTSSLFIPTAATSNEGTGRKHDDDVLDVLCKRRRTAISWSGEDEIDIRFIVIIVQM
jgi:hypothetical protein